MDKKRFITKQYQSGAVDITGYENPPGITINEEGQGTTAGKDKVMILADGKQTVNWLWQPGCFDNIPHRLSNGWIINNPSARYDANGAAGIINIVYKTNKAVKVNENSLTTGPGALWQKRENLPAIRPAIPGHTKTNLYH